MGLCEYAPHTTHNCIGHSLKEHFINEVFNQKGNSQLNRSTKHTKELQNDKYALNKRNTPVPGDIHRKDIVGSVPPCRRILEKLVRSKTEKS